MLVELVGVQQIKPVRLLRRTMVQSSPIKANQASRETLGFSSIGIPVHLGVSKMEQLKSDA
jgi:hypothetical protein